MEEKIKEAFGTVRASEEIKRKTQAFIAQKTHGYTVCRALNYRKILPLAAACCLALILLAGTGLYFTPIARIDIDINPSLELGINRFDKVVSINPLNDDGKKLSKSLDIKFADYEDALQKILENNSVKAMLSDNEVMTVTVIETNVAQSDNILSEARACVKGYSNVYCHSASSKDAAAARELGLPCGKYRAFLELQELGSDITPEEVCNMTMRQIRELINSLSGNSNSEIFPSSAGNGHHGNCCGHGHGMNE